MYALCVLRVETGNTLLCGSKFKLLHIVLVM